MSLPVEDPTHERPLAILKVGATEAVVRERQGGDFEHWFARGLGIALDEHLVVQPHLGEELPDASELSAAVVTGSSAMVTDHAEWSVRTTAWLAGAVASGLPVLAICYGHQLLAEAFEGRCAWSPNGREIGTVRIELTPDARDDPLLAGLRSPLIVQESHSQVVAELPPDAVRLAGNAHDPHQGFRIGERAWGFQFHPEFDATIVRGYIEARREAIAGEGLDVEALIAGLRDDPAGSTILARFGQLVRASVAPEA